MRCVSQATLKKQKIDIFSLLLRDEIKRAGLSQIEFAQKLGMTPQSLGDYTNARRLPGYELLLRFAAALGVSPRVLVPAELEPELAAQLATLDDTSPASPE